MRFILDGLPVAWPFESIYPEQFHYILNLKRGLDAGGSILLEMPSGTGKTVSLLALIMSYQRAHPERVSKLIYCSRTVSEIEKVLEEAKLVVDELCRFDDEDQATTAGDGGGERGSGAARRPLRRQPLVVGLTSRRNLCVHPQVSKERHAGSVDAKCRNKTASFVRERAGIQVAQRNARRRKKLASGNKRGTKKQKPGAADGNRQGDNGNDDGAGDQVDGSDDDGEETAAPPPDGSVPAIEDLVNNPSLCSFYERFDRAGREFSLRGVYTLEDMRRLGEARGWCPYFLNRQLLASADVVVYSYQYVLDPKVADFVSKEFQGGSAVLVFDEAHNIDNVCIDALSVRLDRNTVEAAARNLMKLDGAVRAARETSAERLQAEYRALVEGLARTGSLTAADAARASPALSADELREAVPGNIRHAEHFLGLMRRFVEHVRLRLRAPTAQLETPLAFCAGAAQAAALESKSLRFAAMRLQQLTQSLELRNADQLTPLVLMADFATLVATYQAGFLVIIEPAGDRSSGGGGDSDEPVLHFRCLDASVAMRPVLEKYRSVIITSGTLSPLEMYPRMLAFEPRISVRFPMSLTRQCVAPLIVTRGADQAAVSSRFEDRADPGVTRNYGQLLADLSAVVPDGIVCFFPSYQYLEATLDKWTEMGVVRTVSARKLLFIEVPDTAEATLALLNYRRACDVGRGAVLLAVGRGKVSEGIDFDGHYGRAVILFGIPYVYTQSRILRARLEYLRDHFQIRENEFLTFDAMRTAAQCVGRVIRGKDDYGAMIFADARYSRADKRNKLPQWVQQHLVPSCVDLSTDEAVAVVRKFLKQMAQPVDRADQMGRSLWSLDHVLQQSEATPIGSGAQ